MLKKLISLVAYAAFFVACSDDSSTGPSPALSGDSATQWRNHCLDKINELRATEDLKPLVLADKSKQECTDKQAGKDMSSNKAHGNFGSCGEFAQNSAPNFKFSWYKDETDALDSHLESMWNEKKLIESGAKDPDKKEDYPAIGHYLNMTNPSAKEVACGISSSNDGTTGWININFF